MKTVAKDDTQAGGASTRSAVVRLSNAIALEPYQSDLEFLTNMGLASRCGQNNAIAQSEIHRSYYAYTVAIDLDRIGIDGALEISQEEKAERVKVFLDAVHYLYRDIKGRRENFSPLFIIGGRYNRKNPFFENRVRVEKNKINVSTLREVLEEDKDIENNTVVGVMTNIFDNDQEIREELNATTVGKVFDHLKEEVEKYYGESN